MLRIQKIQPLCTSCSNLKLNPSKNQLIISWSLIFWEQFFVWLLFGQILSDYSLILFRWPSMQRYTMPDSHRYLFFRIIQLKNKVFYFCQNCFIIHWKCRLYEMGRISTWITFIWNRKDFNMNYDYMKWEGFQHELRLYEMGRISTWITFMWNRKDFNMNYVYMK